MEDTYSVNYVEDYIDVMENLPDEIQRKITPMREYDVQFQELLNDIDKIKDEILKKDSSDVVGVKNLLVSIEKKLISTLDIGDSKINSMQSIQDLIDQKSRLLENDARKLEMEIENEHPESAGRERESSERASKRPRRTARAEASLGGAVGGAGSSSSMPSGAALSGAASSSSLAATSSGAYNSNGSGLSQGNNHLSSSGSSVGIVGLSSGAIERLERLQDQESPHLSSFHDKSSSGVKGNSGKGLTQKKTTKKKKRKTRVERDRDDSPSAELPIDPDEPTYCLCEQVSYGEMIGCDNDLCPIEWFHFSCVSLTNKPKGKWFCPRCRGDKPTVMKPRAIFLRELEKYNKEKEEKL